LQQELLKQERPLAYLEQNGQKYYQIVQLTHQHLPACTLIKSKVILWPVVGLTKSDTIQSSTMMAIHLTERQS